MYKQSLYIAFSLLLLTILYYLPVIINPDLILNRGNDLQEFFWPIFYYIKQHILLDKSLPFWNNLFLSGVPLLPDPQSFLFYPPNLIFLFLPMETAFLSSFYIHTLFGSLGAYLCATKIFKMSKPTSIFLTSLYIFSPKIAGYLEAGHYGLVISYAYLPYIFLSVVMLVKSPKNTWPISLALSLAGVFYTHSVTFILVVAATIFIFIITLFNNYKKHLLKGSLLFFFLCGLLTFGLIAVTLLPQIEWMPETTRFLLLESKDVYPKWFSKQEFIQNIFIPWFNGPAAAGKIDSEKWLSLGMLPSALAILGFLTLRRKGQFFVAFLSFIIILISLNNASPLYSILLSQEWYLLMRVSTRTWFIIIFIVIFLAGFGFEFLYKKTRPLLLFFIAFLTIGELLFLSWSRLFIPPSLPTKTPSDGVLQFLKQDHEHFRIFCLNRCISQQNAAIYGLELIDGYNTLLQKNYYKHMWQLSGGYWNYYTLALPPVGSYAFGQLQPDAESLGLYNNKYVISPHLLTDKKFLLVQNIDGYNIYKNSSFKNRAYYRTEEITVDISAPIIKYTPNHIKIDTSSKLSNQLILAEVYSRGWVAYLDGQEKTPVWETPNSLRQVDLKTDTRFVDFKYEPESFKKGFIVTISTLILLLFLTVRRLIKR